MHSGKLSWLKLIEKMTVNPARIIRRGDRGTLGRGMVADITIFNPDEIWTLSAQNTRSRSHNTPFAARPLRGRVRHTIKGGRVVYSAGV